MIKNKMCIEPISYFCSYTLSRIPKKCPYQELTEYYANIDFLLQLQSGFMPENLCYIVILSNERHL